MKRICKSIQKGKGTDDGIHSDDDQSRNMLPMSAEIHPRPKTEYVF